MAEKRSKKPRNIDGVKRVKKTPKVEIPMDSQEDLAAAIDGFANAEYDDVPENPDDYSDEVDIAPSETAKKTPVTIERSEQVTVAELNDGTEEIEDQDIEALINDGVVESSAEISESVTENNAKEDRALNSIKRSDKKEEKMRKKQPKTAKPYRIISRILAIVTTILLGALITYISLSGALPVKYIIPAYAVAVIFSALYLFKTFRKKTRIVPLTIFNIFGLILAVGSIFGFLKYNELMSFLDKNLNSNASYDVYNVIVSKKSSYNNLNDVKGKEFHSISDFINTEKLEAAVKEQVNGSVVYADGITSMLKSSIDDPNYISLLNAGTWDATIDTDEGKSYPDSLKIIGEIKVESEKKERASTGSITDESWIMFISGIDTRSGQMLERSLSDVNIIMTVNPKTKHILMTAVPRDYYVQLHGTTGLPDKLTHAGSLGGIQLSMATIEDLMDIEFSQYLRANFNAVIGLVDAIGGITVNSDVNYSFKCHTNPSCTINPGLNTLNGECALAFARERMAYSSGDRHRGENQEQVIEKIFEKVTSSSTILSKYSEILNALSGSFETSLTTSDITSLVNMELDENMPKWTIETYNLNGTTGGAYTYSYPSQTLSVMYPDQSTIDTAKAKIKAVLAGKSANSVNTMVSEPAAE